MTPDIDVLVEAPAWDALPLAQLVTDAATATLDHLGMTQEVEISVLATDDARIAMLNAEFREKPSATNVLSWPSNDLSPDSPGARPHAPPIDPFEDRPALGDIALAFETCAKEAAQAQKPQQHHVAHLIVHGILHLLGYDHVNDADAALMEREETAILAKLGIPDPYGLDETAPAAVLREKD